ncbi:branched-chain amino acid ABC transporter permease [Mesobaculum littorinae]|uniref:Branched-chain amino acid ABC transporter permease n=1 Tax=Mesobaculum littorinae TaxID=2486419 RepID=A0A438AMQ3_9RHOB|nr:branched-chain amino acid ABC transporter permease [Mesobaculum littorinae]RVV99939.1 branched-chain amino acid ABC transporter permease [Mesobaculum littorinae]
MRSANPRLLLLCAAVVAALFALQFVLSEYLVLTATRILILAIFAMGYNMLMGYTGMLSLGHAMFFAAGVYAAGLSSYYWGLSLPLAFVLGVGASFAVSLVTGLLVLRTQAVAFMIVTLMFAQVTYLTTLQFSDITGGDQGLTLPTGARGFTLMGIAVDLTRDSHRYNLALALFTATLAGLFALTQGRRGRLFAAVRENAGRTEMLGFNTFRIRLVAFVVSGTLSGMSGALYALMFGYIGSAFAGFELSIEALLFTLVGGPGTLLGPLLGTGVMTLLIDRLSGVTSAYLIVVGALLIAVNQWAPAGLLGTLRDRRLPWLK